VPQELRYSVVAAKVEVRDEPNRESKNIWSAEDLDHDKDDHKSAPANVIKKEESIADVKIEVLTEEEGKTNFPSSSSAVPDSADTKLLASLVDGTAGSVDVDVDPLTRGLAVIQARHTLQQALRQQSTPVAQFTHSQQQSSSSTGQAGIKSASRRS
jgi:hypothetical protein